MKQCWKVKKLGEVCTIGDGNYSSKYPKASEFVSQGIPFLTATNLKAGTIIPEEIRYISKEQHSTLTKGHIKKNDLVIVVRGSSTGNNSLVPDDYEGSNLNSQLAFLRIKDKELDSKYLFFVFNSPVVQQIVLNTISGAAQPQLPNNKLLDIEISYPPLSEQKRIVAILDEAFGAISKAKANAEQNLKNAKELFESYLQNIFEKKGEGWEEKRINEVCELKSGTTISTSLEKSEGDVLYTKVADMNLPGNSIVIHTSSRFVNSNEIKRNQIIPNGAIIFPKRGGAIATNKKRKIIKPTIVDLNTMAIIPGKKIKSDYFFHWFQLFDLNSISNGANIPQINNYSFDEVYIPYPASLKEQQTIVQKLDELSAETKKLEALYQKKIEDLEELKKSILQKAFSGELWSPEGAASANDGQSPSDKKMKPITNPERA
jgi:type I restriction enzyme S subunit